MEHLSNIELYYTSPELVDEEIITLKDDEFHHAVNVMRNSIDDILHITDGIGNLYKTKIVQIKKSKLTAIILERKAYQNRLEKIWFCIPILKNPDRLKFAFEKCVELGITNFILFTSRNSISKKINTEKFQKTHLSAMKQSLRSFLPKIIFKSFNEIINLLGTKILFDQKSNNVFESNIVGDDITYFLFGPEGGFNKEELDSVTVESRFTLSTNRLRSETAIIKCASLLNLP